MYQDAQDEGRKDVINRAIELLEESLVPYQDRRRGRFEGPRMLHQSLELKESFYGFAYIGELKREVLFGEGGDSGDETDLVEEENEEENDEDDKKQDDKGGKKPDEDDDMPAFFKFYKKQRLVVRGRFGFMIACQILLTWFLGYEAFTDDE